MKGLLGRSCTQCALLVVLVALVLCRPAVAQEPADAAPPQTDDPATIFPHSNNERWYLAGQINIIEQGHPEFSARYSGPNSLRPTGEIDQSRVLTLYAGYQLTRTTDVLVAFESAGGRGISDALGLAGFTNLDVVRNPSLGAKPYLSRLLVHQVVPLTGDKVESDRTFTSLATEMPARRLEFYVGKFSIPDFIDNNGVGSDSHLQFMNWTLDNNGAYDYAADTRGYTWGAMAMYQDRRWALRFAETLMPKMANGIDLQWNLRKARAENIELELRPALSKQHNTTLRLLSYVNHASMGDYRDAVRLFREGVTSTLDVIATRRQGRVKYGFGLNLEQELSSTVRAFGRFGWNEGRHESFAYTEVNGTVALGADWRPERWGRKLDRWGAAFVSNGISRDHQLYLKPGGLGFLLGDGNLSYGRENILETYYTAHVWRGVFVSADVQHVTNPGYNRDRGPVWVPALRLHFDL